MATQLKPLIAKLSVSESRYVIVFLDLQMHGMSGYKVARQSRNRVDLKNVVLIALSGQTDDASRQLAIVSEFDHHVAKPTSVRELAETVQRVSEVSAC